MQKLLLILLLNLCILSACSDGTIIIKDLSKEHVEVLKSKDKHPHNIRFDIKGEADGSFMVFSRHFEKGPIDTSILSDWYADTLKFIYKPISARKGYLKIKYIF